MSVVQKGREEECSGTVCTCLGCRSPLPLPAPSGERCNWSEPAWRWRRQQLRRRKKKWRRCAEELCLWSSPVETETSLHSTVGWKLQWEDVARGC